jgi:hypothetical protein
MTGSHLCLPSDEPCTDDDATNGWLATVRNSLVQRNKSQVMKHIWLMPTVHFGSIGGGSSSRVLVLPAFLFIR